MPACARRRASIDSARVRTNGACSNPRTIAPAATIAAAATPTRLAQDRRRMDSRCCPCYGNARVGRSGILDSGENGRQRLEHFRVDFELLVAVLARSEE